MSERPWYRRFPDNFIAGTVGLSLEEKGAYSLILDLIYVRGGPVPDESRYIAGVCNCSVRKWNAIRQRLLDLGKIEVIDGCLMNHRAQEELIISSKTAQERVESGRKGGEKSAEIRTAESKNKDLGQADLNHTRASPLQYPYRKKERENVLEEKKGETLKLDRWADEALFKACEALTGEKIPEYQQFKSWPTAIVEQAKGTAVN